MFRIGKVNGSARGESHQIDCGRDEAIILLLYVSDFFVQYYNIWIEFFSDSRVCKVFSSYPPQFVFKKFVYRM